MFDISHIHPMIVHFPIALLIFGFLADLISVVFKKAFFGKAGLYLLIFGTLGVIAAYFSGNIAGDGLTEAGPLKNAIEFHQNTALISLWIMVLTSFVRIGFIMMKKYEGAFKWAALLLFFAGVLSIARTGYYGGELVFKHAAGVQFNLGNSLNSNELENNSGSTENKAE